MMSDHTVYLSLGSNLGSREDNILRAVSEFSSEKDVRVVNLSSLYETKPQDFSTKTNFINAACELKTSLEPLPLFQKLSAVESGMGRRRGPGLEDRTIDIDVLLYDELEISTDVLVVPHPRMFERPFVMIPLNEIAPRMRIPPTMADIEDIVSSLTTEYWVRRVSTRFVGSVSLG